MRHAARIGLAGGACVLIAAGAALAAEPPAPLAPPVAYEHAGPRNVLVVFNAESKDTDGNGLADGREIAEYYARRRGIPEENLLGLKLRGADKGTDYRNFFEKILTPVREKLHAKAADGTEFRERICYIMLTPGMPVGMKTHHTKAEHPLSHKSWVGWRSVDQWLISLEDNYSLGVHEESGKPGMLKPPYPLAFVRIGGKYLVHIPYRGRSLAALSVAGKQLGAIPFTGEGRLGDLTVGDGKLGDIDVGSPGKPLRVGDIDVGSKEKPLKLGDVELTLPKLHLGSFPGHIRSPLLGAFVGKKPTTFMELRRKVPGLAGKYLVMRLGNDPGSARRAVDGAIYAEMYLKGNGEDPALSIWLDQKFGFAFDQVRAQVQCCSIVHAEGDLFKTDAAGPLAPWPLVIDNQGAEIGMRLKDGRQQKPTATATVASVEGEYLVLKPKRLKRGSSPTSIYFAPGREITVTGGDAKAIVKSVDAKKSRLLVSSTEGFKAGDGIVSVWPGEYPSRDCFFFFGFYGLGKYEDVFAFPPGSIGVHVDSACGKWAAAAMSRGIAGTFGVTAEPFSAGIPYGQIVLATLGRGNDLAEAFGSSVVFGQRWMGVSYGDPLYAPFRGPKRADATKPVLAVPSVSMEAGGANISARLGGETADELADVALFRIEYGRSRRMGEAVDFYDWPEPADPNLKVKGRNYSGYARSFSRLVTGLEEGRRYYYRVVARDPAGNESSSRRGAFIYRTPGATKR